MALNTTANQQVGGGEAVSSAEADGLDVFANAWAEENGEEPVTPEADAEEEENTADPQEELEDGETEETEPEPEDEPEKYEVTVDGQKLHVAKDELIRGYQRLSDYTRKTQEVAEGRKQLEARAAMIEQAEAYALSLLERYDTQEQEPNWAELQRQDPLGFQEKQAQWLDRQREIRAVQAERERIQQQQTERYQQQMAMKVRTEAQTFLSKLADAKGDRRKAAEIYNSAMQHAAQTYGFSAEELGTTVDHRVGLALVDAMKWRQLQKAKPATSKQITAAPKSPRPGQPAPTSQRLAQRMSAASDRLRATGSVDAFAEMWTAAQGR